MDHSAVSVDVVALRFWAADSAVTFGIAARRREPYPGRLVLPGVLLHRGEWLSEAAARAVHDDLGVPTAALGPVGRLVTFDEPKWDPSGPTLSVVMWAVTRPHRGTVRWVPFDESPPAAFEHGDLVAAGRDMLAGLLWKNLPFTRALLGDRFPATRAVDLASSLLGARPDAANLNRTLAGIPGLTKTGERRRTRATGRPAAVWAFTDPPA